MLKKKAINRIFFTTIVFFIFFAFYSLKLVTNTNDKEAKTIKNKEIIYTLNNDNYISKTEIYVGKFYTLEDKIKEKLETMVEKNNKNALLPSYFKPILPENTKVLKVKVEDSLVKVYFSKELENINKEQSEKMIEAIIYTITDENILGIEIYVEDQMLKYVPHTKKELPTILTKEFGINKSYEISSVETLNKVVMTYYTNYKDNYYEVPVTKYISDDREKLEIIFEELNSVSKEEKLINLLDKVKVNNYKIGENSITIDLSSDITAKEGRIIASSIFNNYDIENIKILVNNEKKYEKTKKDIEN